MLTSLLIDLGKTRDIRITVDLSNSTSLGTISCRCLLRVLLGHRRGLLNVSVLGLLFYDVKHTGLKTFFVPRQEILFPIIIVGIHV